MNIRRVKFAKKGGVGQRISVVNAEFLHALAVNFGPSTVVLITHELGFTAAKTPKCTVHIHKLNLAAMAPLLCSIP